MRERHTLRDKREGARDRVQRLVRERGTETREREQETEFRDL